MSTEVDDETILDVLRSSDESRLTTTTVAEGLPVTRGTTRTRLQQLADEGRVRREKSGNHVVWWLPESDDGETAEGEAAGDASADDADASEGDASGPDGEADAGSGEAGGDEGESETAEGGEPESDGTEQDEPASGETETGSGGADGDDDTTDVPVEAVSPDGTTVEAGDEAEERRPTADGQTLERDDEEGLRAVALVAVALVVVLLLRRLIRDDGTA